MSEQEKLEFCPNCGAKLKPGAVFCGNCGFDIAKYKAAHNGIKSTGEANSSAARQTMPSMQNVRQQVSTSPTRPVKPIKKWPWVVAAVVVAAFVGLYMFGQSYYSSANQLNRAVAAIKNNDKNVGSYFTTGDGGMKLNNKSLQPLIKQMQANPNALKGFKSQLQNNGSTSNNGYSFGPSGHIWLLFTRYKINAKTFTITLHTNQPGINLSVNKRNILKTSQATIQKKSGPYIAGQYQLKAEGDVNGHHMVNDGTYNLSPESAKDFDLQLKTISFTVTGYAGADVLINGKSQGKLDSNGSLQLNDIPWSNNMMLTMAYNGAGGKVTSRSHKITDSDQDSEVTVGYPGVMSHDSADSLISELFSDVDRISSNGSIPSGFSDYFVNGSDNTQYNDIVKMAKGYHQKDSGINTVSYRVEDLHVVPNKVNQSTVTYNIRYDFFNKNDSEHIQVFQYVATIVKAGSTNKIQSIAAAKKISDVTNGGDDDSDSDSNNDSDEDSNSDSDNDDNDNSDSSDSDEDDNDNTDDESYQVNPQRNLNLQNM